MISYFCFIFKLNEIDENVMMLSSAALCHGFWFLRLKQKFHCIESQSSIDRLCSYCIESRSGVLNCVVIT